MSDEASFDVVGIGNAIVDVIARAGDDFLVREGLAKGSMRLIDEREADGLYALMRAATESSGGSAANTIAGVASLGGRAGFLGKVRDDALGDIFRHDIASLGVAFPSAAAEEGPGTARSLILVTPDGERTMNTYLGAAQAFGPDDVHEPIVQAARCLYLEGYLWDPPAAKDAFLKAARIAHEAGREVALTLSDSFCVERYRGEFLELIADRTVDIVFANEHEVRALYETGDLDTAISSLAADCRHAVVTRSEKGCSVLRDGERSDVEAWEVDEVVDLTGAGDLFAAG
ncbi:MAG: adenosine kinase [Flavobacteriaceae bacterium]